MSGRNWISIFLVMISDQDYNPQFMSRAFELALQGAKSSNGGPFGAVVVKDGRIIGEGTNRVTANNDPTAHAEVSAIRMACNYLSDFQLSGCIIYSSCEPCPMCLGAIYWARLAKVFFAATRFDAARGGFDDALIYSELPLPPENRSIPMIHIVDEKSTIVFKIWEENPLKKNY